MIKLIDHYSQLCGFNDIAAIKMRSSVIAYGCDRPFLMTWRQITDGNTTALIQKQDNNMLITVADNADIDELAKFISVIGYDNAFSTTKTANLLGNMPKTSGIVMKLQDEKQINAECFEKIIYPDYKRLYNLLKHSNLDVPDFEPFYLDLSYRIRHNTARVFASGDYSALAFTAFEDECAAVISAVAVTKELRGKGYGKKALLSLCNDLIKDKKDIYLYRESDKNEGFYSSAGFANCDEFVVF